MTISYTNEVSTSKGFGCFLKLLLRWQGSIYKLVWLDLVTYFLAYYIINFIYRFALDGTSKAQFEIVIKYCDTYGNLIPVSFVLGFYVNLIMTRWWNQYSSIPYPDNLAILISAIIQGEQDRSVIIRRTIIRYICLTFSITMSMISPRIKKRFPTLNHFVEAGLMNKEEKKIMEELDEEFPSYSKYWLPLTWAANITTRARNEGLIRDDMSVKSILSEINSFRSRCGTLLDYDWISVPLVYTQVVTLAVYTYFLISLIGRQSLIIYFPILTVLEYFFYVGWLKVAEILINPFGDDDDDFEIFWMIDRHVQVSYLIVDKIHEEHPQLVRDQYWLRKAPNVLPYTLGSEKFLKEYPCNSTSNITMQPMDSEMLIPNERRITGERVDGALHLKKQKRSIFSRLFKSTPIESNMNHDLSAISHSNLSEITSIKNGHDLHNSKKEFKSNLLEFNKLKNERKLKAKEKLRLYIQLLQNKDENIGEALINKLINK